MRTFLGILCLFVFASANARADNLYILDSDTGAAPTMVLAPSGSRSGLQNGYFFNCVSANACVAQVQSNNPNVTANFSQPGAANILDAGSSAVSDTILSSAGSGVTSNQWHLTFQTSNTHSITPIPNSAITQNLTEDSTAQRVFPLNWSDGSTDQVFVQSAPKATASTDQNGNATLLIPYGQSNISIDMTLQCTSGDCLSPFPFTPVDGLSPNASSANGTLSGGFNYAGGYQLSFSAFMNGSPVNILSTGLSSAQYPTSPPSNYWDTWLELSPSPNGSNLLLEFQTNNFGGLSSIVALGSNSAALDFSGPNTFPGIPPVPFSIDPNSPDRPTGGAMFLSSNPFVGSSTAPPSVPEPSTIVLLGTGLIGIGCNTIRKFRSQLVDVVPPDWRRAGGADRGRHHGECCDGQYQVAGSGF